MKKYLLPLILILALIFSANCFATAWEIDTAVYEDKYKYISDDAWYPYGVFFKPDGSKMYIVAYYDQIVCQYSLSVAWEIDTAVYEEKYKYVDAQDSYPVDLFFKPDGSKMYITGYTSVTLYQYTLSTPWDVSSSTYDTKSKYIGSEDSEIFDLFFKFDGLKMYVVGKYYKRIYQYSLVTAWDISTASYETKYKDVGSEDDYPMGIFFKPDGDKMYVVGSTNDTIYQYALTIPWDIPTASYENKYKYVGSEDSYPTDVFLKPDGSKVYIMGEGNETVYQYLLPVPPPEAVNSFFFGTNF